MILVDFSSILHRMLHTSIKDAKPKKTNGVYNTAEYINITKHMILQELMNMSLEHKLNFGEMVICLDDKSGYWRRDFYSGYKQSRKKDRDESDVNFSEVFEELNGLIEQIHLNLPWKTILVPKAEADDTMLVLAKEYNSFEKVLILSPDKDMIQAQKDNETVLQYSSLTKKWLVPENKHDHMGHWVQEHVCLGDVSDCVPKIVDGTEFSPSFLKYLKENDVDEEFNEVFNFKYGVQDKDGDVLKALTIDEKTQLLSNFDVFKLNRKKENTGVKDVYKDMRFGPSNLQKSIDKHGSLDKWLDSHPLYREHFDRNFTLVMTEGIPTDIWNEILISYKEAKTDYNKDAFIDYLSEFQLKSLEMDLPLVFKDTEGLTADNCGW